MKQILKSLAIFSLGLLFASSVYSQPKTDLETRSLRGKIKSVETYNLYGQSAAGWSNRYLWTAETFNTGGNLTERQVFRDEQIVSKVIYLYDERGRKVGNKSYSGSTGKLEETPTLTELILNNAGLTSELNVYYKVAETAEVIHKFKYDERGNLLETDYGLAGKSVLTYDARNNQTSRLNSNLLGTVYNKNYAEYNERNQLVKETIYEGEELRYEIKYKYDPQNRLTEKETTEFNRNPNMRSSHAPIPGKLIYAYDDQLKTSMTTKYSLSGAMEPNSISIYNESGEQIGYNCAIGELQSCRTVAEYKIDDTGNTVRKTYYDRKSSGEQLVARGAEEKVITYY